MVNNFELSHLVIRDHSYVAGTSEKPEVKVFVQTNNSNTSFLEWTVIKFNLLGSHFRMKDKVLHFDFL